MVLFLGSPWPGKSWCDRNGVIICRAWIGQEWTNLGGGTIPYLILNDEYIGYTIVRTYMNKYLISSDFNIYFTFQF